jgi:hypothetical protein
MPLEPRPETEAYRLCQPMHVLSFGEGRLVKVLLGCLRRLKMALSVSTSRETIRVVKPKGFVNSCDHENT